MPKNTSLPRPGAETQEKRLPAVFSQALDNAWKRKNTAADLSRSGVSRFLRKFKIFGE